MALQLNRTYRFKFYLNANHYIIINGVEGETHPHTWEFTIDIMIKMMSSWNLILTRNLSASILPSIKTES